jgi:hypothetical protein
MSEQPLKCPICTGIMEEHTGKFLWWKKIFYYCKPCNKIAYWAGEPKK